MWLILALSTALCISLADISGKKVIHRVEAYIVSWAWMFFSLPLLYTVLWVRGVPPVTSEFFPALAASTVFVSVASILYFKAIESSDLSVCMPMMAFTPLFLLVTSPLMLGESPKAAGMLGILLIVIGSYVLHFHDRHKGYLQPFKSLLSEPGARYMLGVAVIFGISANIDKIGVRSSSPLMWIATLNTSLSLVLWIVVRMKVKGPGKQIRSVWPYLLMVGAWNGLAMIFQMTAIQMTMVPYLIGVKRTSVIMTSLFGFFLFKEKGLSERLTGAILMVAGVLMISFFQ